MREQPSPSLEDGQNTCVGAADVVHIASERPSDSKQDERLATDGALAHIEARAIP